MSWASRVDVPSGSATRRIVPTRPWYDRVLDSAGFYISTCRIKNWDIPLAVWVGAHSGEAGRGLAGLETNRTVCPENM